MILFSVYKPKASSDVFLQGIMFFGMEIHCMQLLNLTINAYMVFYLFFMSRHFSIPLEVTHLRWRKFYRFLELIQQPYINSEVLT